MLLPMAVGDSPRVPSEYLSHPEESLASLSPQSRSGPAMEGVKVNSLFYFINTES